MTDTYRALCVELLAELENAIRVIYREDGTHHISTADAVIARADTALAAEPPADGEVAELVDSLRSEAGCEEIYGNCATITATELRRAADLLERLAPQPEPPADGAVADDRPCTCHPDDNPPRPCPKRYALNECKDFAERGAAELVACLSDSLQAFGFTQQVSDYPIDHWSCRAADLLSRLTPQPVPDGPTRRVYFDMPSQIAECGGPCSEGGPEACDCGALWRDEPAPQPQPVPEGPSDQEIADVFAEGCIHAGKSGEPPFLGGARAVLARWGRT